MSEDPANEYFADGLAEELLNMLVKVPQLRVAARTSSFSFKDKDVAPLSINQNSELVIRCTDESLTLEVQVTGSGPLALQWFKDGEALTGADSDTYHIAALSAAHMGFYHCEVVGPCDEGSSIGVQVIVDCSFPQAVAAWGGPDGLPVTGLVDILNLIPSPIR